MPGQDWQNPLSAPDAFLGGRLQIVQSRAGHRAGLDAVMVAAASPVRGQAGRVLDAGTGAGVVGLCVAARVANCTVAGVEIDPELAKLANANAARNGLNDRFTAYAHDLTAPLKGLPDGLRPNAFDIVLANPPFFAEGSGTPSPQPARARASVMPDGGLDAWVRFMTAMAAPGGALLIIEPAALLGQILEALQGRCGGIVVFPLFPRLGEPAHRVIVGGIKGSRAPLAIRPGLVLHGAGNDFTPEAEAVLRHGAALAIGL